MHSKDTIVEIRDGGEVRAALVLEELGAALRLLHPDGREVRVPRSRVVHDTGASVPSSSSQAERLADLARFEQHARDLAPTVDLPALHAACAGASPADLGLADLTVLALGTDTPADRAAVHRALATPNAHFRFDGQHFAPLDPDEVARELARRETALRLQAERDAFLTAARTRLVSGAGELPVGSTKFLRCLREVALEGDAARSRKEAAALLTELAAVRPAGAQDQEVAFETLVRLGVFSRDENLALLRADVHVEFLAAVGEEAERLAARGFDRAGRTDLTQLEVVTIDDASTREIDDGVSLERRAGELRLGIHVADATAYLPVGSLVDEEALARSTSYYLPEGSIPMLPACLAEGAASLVEGEERPGLSFLVTLTPHGEVLRTDLQRTIIRVARRMTYDDCEAVLAGQAAEPAWLRDIQPLTEAFERARRAAGATAIRAPEITIEFDDAGEPVVLLTDPGRPARRLVSELMILANHVAAEFCRSRGLPAIYRRQAAPDPSVVPPSPDVYDPVAVARFRRALSRTEVSLEPGLHSSLGLPAYLQATSPIRRYQDVAVHRLIVAALEGKPSPHSRQEMQVIAAATEQAGRQARSVENETDDYWILRHLELHLGAVIPGIIVRRDDRRTHVELTPYAKQFQLAPRPDHVEGKAVNLRVRSVRPRRGLVTFEEVTT